MIPGEEHIRDLQRELDRQSSQKTRIWWEAYLRGVIPFRGVGIPQIRSILAEWRARHRLEEAPVTDQLALALKLFEQPTAEDKLAGVLFLQYYLLADLPWRVAVTKYRRLYRDGLIDEWNTCDWFCVRVLGPTIAIHGPQCARAIAAWSRAVSVWQARSGVVAFVTVASEQRYHPLILRSCAIVIRRDQRFAKTAVGWVLRDLSKHDPGVVKAFIERQLPQFSVEALRNALKYSSPSQQQRYIQRLKRLSLRS